MEEFDKTRTCPQCSAEARYVYHRGAFECPMEAQPHMHRECKVCAYDWAETPVIS